MKLIFKILTGIIIVIFIGFFIGYFIFADNYEKTHPSPYPNCSRMIKTDAGNEFINGKNQYIVRKSVVYQCKDGTIIPTNETP